MTQGISEAQRTADFTFDLNVLSRLECTAEFTLNSCHTDYITGNSHMSPHKYTRIPRDYEQFK